MTYYIRAAVLEDAHTIAPLLREADKNEIAAMSGLTPIDALEYSISDSYEATIVFRPDGSPIALFGIGGDGHGNAVPWMVGTDEMSKYRKVLIRDARVWIEYQCERFPILYNYVDARNTTHVSWLRHMGFTIYDIVPEYIGHDRDVPFYLFTRSK